MDNSLKYKIIDLLQNLSVCNINSAKTEYTVRCPYCGDSQKDLSHGHFAIHIDVNNDDAILYRCLKCSVSGILNGDVLNELQLNTTPDTNDQLRNFNRKVVKKNNLTNANYENYTVPLYSSTPSNDLKLKYLNNRIGTTINYSEAKDLKIVFDIFEFLRYNKIDAIPGLSFKKQELLNKYYIGWLSTNNNCITFRRIIDDNNLMRYIKIILNPHNINGNTFYSIPNKIDLLYTQNINIHIAEGIFDITSVYKNLQNSNLQNNYFYAACGFGYLTILKYLIYNGINTGLNIHIYSDNDKTDKDHIQYLFKRSAVGIWIDHIYIHRNRFSGEKDYGVPINRIDDSKLKIK